MNNKGYTLIELITTITLLVIVGLVISNNIIGLFSNQDEKELEELTNKIQDAACMYVETNWDSTKRVNCKYNNNCSITIDDLVSAGYLEEKLTNPETDEVISGSVDVRWNDNVKTCVWNG
jgi:prepilin-type N-terminal cleavage/methylation domain-containing protein